MISTLNELKRRSIALGLCGRYKGAWDECSSPQDLCDLATDINGLAFLCDACSFGWGGTFNADYIADRFADFINGRYTRNKDGYTTALYCKDEGVVYARTTALCLIDCTSTVIVPHDSMVEILVGGNSDITVMNLGKITKLAIYGNATVNGRHRAESTERITESIWKRA